MRRKRQKLQVAFGCDKSIKLLIKGILLLSTGSTAEILLVHFKLFIITLNNRQITGVIAFKFFLKRPPLSILVFRLFRWKKCYIYSIPQV